MPEIHIDAISTAAKLALARRPGSLIAHDILNLIAEIDRLRAELATARSAGMLFVVANLYPETGYAGGTLPDGTACLVAAYPTHAEADALTDARSCVVALVPAGERI